MITYGWAAFGGIILWGIGVGMGIRHQQREQRKHQLAGVKGFAAHLMAQAVSQGLAGSVRVTDEDGKVVHEEVDIPVDGPPKH
jgi:hypothetical protein